MWLVVTVTIAGVVPATEYLKESGLPMTGRGELVVDSVSVTQSVT